MNYIRLAFAVLVCSSVQLWAKEATEFTIPNTHTLQIKSETSGLEYELYVRLPKGYSASTKKYPVAVLNDTGYSIAVASGIVHLMAGRDIEDVIIVGISYSKGHNLLISRTRDYTPTFAPNEKRGHSQEAQKHSGKARQYISFISDEVLPLISKAYRIRQDKKIFVGHSYGGLLGANILISNPALFDYYILGSPSFWYDNKVMFRLEADYAKKNKAMKANVFMYIGSEEGDMVDHMLEFDEQLKSRNYQGLNVQPKVLPGLTHYSAFAVLLTDGLQKAIPKKKVTNR
ncbi:alpha/beta hydrolase-fold protein [Microbulbifer sp. OS29]|uniref:Alpha/beta hydrolase-fold protein n=1 Tax=Microbulbifer okhotskensis TaxID=2926617 RepID=A0A9X2J6N5_9GAMM|nr:alpha/beta hydrolase-fold protein [Microbulbifer okhotskensis]MCO1335594.1 alpha/beta hydrolase-fold protein [Microbulbifer okhotskensis]